MFVALLELLGEFLLQIAVEVLVELGLHSLAEPFRRAPNPWLAAGALMALVGKWRAQRGQDVLRIDRFAYGYLFALALALVRFIAAH